MIVSINEHTVRDSGSLKATVGLLPARRQGRGRRDSRRTSRRRSTPCSARRRHRPRTPRLRKTQPGAAPLDPAFEGAELADNDSKLPGLLVARVEPGSPAADRGLHAGDVITKVNRVRVHNLGEAKRVIEGARSIILEVQRGGRNQLILMR